MKRRNRLALAAAALAIAPADASETVVYRYDALGRLVAAQHSGTVNNGRANSLCYDPAGNRSLYRSNAAGALAECAPAAAPTNQPPLAAPDSLTAPPCQSRIADVTANDSDPEGDDPVALVAAMSDWAWVQDGVVAMTTPAANGNYPIPYTVADSLGATSNGILTVIVTGGGECW